MKAHPLKVFKPVFVSVSSKLGLHHDYKTIAKFCLDVNLLPQTIQFSWQSISQCMSKQRFTFFRTWLCLFWNKSKAR